MYTTAGQWDIILFSLMIDMIDCISEFSEQYVSCYFYFFFKRWLCINIKWIALKEDRIATTTKPFVSIYLDSIALVWRAEKCNKNDTLHQQPETWWWTTTSNYLERRVRKNIRVNNVQSSSSFKVVVAVRPIECLSTVLHYSSIPTGIQWTIFPKISHKLPFCAHAHTNFSAEGALFFCIHLSTRSTFCMCTHMCVVLLTHRSKQMPRRPIDRTWSCYDPRLIFTTISIFFFFFGHSEACCVWQLLCPLFVCIVSHNFIDELRNFEINSLFWDWINRFSDFPLETLLLFFSCFASKFV